LSFQNFFAGSFQANIVAMVQGSNAVLGWLQGADHRDGRLLQTRVMMFFTS